VMRERFRYGCESHRTYLSQIRDERSTIPSAPFTHHKSITQRNPTWLAPVSTAPLPRPPGM